MIAKIKMKIQINVLCLPEPCGGPLGIKPL
jgi:hypothetical protein